MAYNCCTGAADVLDESSARVFDLVRPSCPRELQVRFRNLIHASRTDRMAACLQTAHSGNGECAIQGNFTLLAKMHALSRFGKTGRFQTQCCDDGIGVVQFKDVYVLRPDLGLLIGFMRRNNRSIERELVVAPGDGQ